jgi:RNA polymerase sigma-70 factor (ECF subfamily)
VSTYLDLGHHLGHHRERFGAPDAVPEITQRRSDWRAVGRIERLTNRRTRLSEASPFSTVADSAELLLRRVACGDHEAFAQLYDELGPSVYGVALRVVRNPSHAEEVTQEVMLEIWRTAARFNSELGRARSWAMTIAHRRAVDRVRSEQSSVNRNLRVGRPDSPPPEPVHEAVVDQLDRQRVRAALGGLTEVQREVIELGYYGGHTQQEISELLDVPLGTVKTRARDGLIRLRDALGEGE